MSYPLFREGHKHHRRIFEGESYFPRLSLAVEEVSHSSRSKTRLARWPYCCVTCNRRKRGSKRKEEEARLLRAPGVVKATETRERRTRTEEALRKKKRGKFGTSADVHSTHGHWLPLRVLTRSGSHVDDGRVFDRISLCFSICDIIQPPPSFPRAFA